MQRAHVSRSVQRLADGSAWPVIRRKLHSSLATFSGGWLRYLLLIWPVLVVTAVLLHRSGHLGIRVSAAECRVGALVVALAVVGVLGAPRNGSGLASMAFALFVGAPLVAPLLGQHSGVSEQGTAPEHRLGGKLTIREQPTPGISAGR